MSEVPFCSDLSRQRDEPLYGTAPADRVWFLLEYEGEWRARAAEDNDLPQSVQAHLQKALSAVKGSRLLFVRRERRPAGAPIHFFVAVTDEATPMLYRFGLDTYQDLLALDLPGIAAGGTAAGHRIDDPLYAVCTNGKRDACCARYGVALYQALRERAPEQVWHSTHIGGHRFAPTLLILPHGINYGRLAPEQARELLARHAEQRLLLRHLRGRTGYPAVGQAADFFLRAKTEDDRLDRFHLQEVRRLDEDEYLVRFDDREAAVVHEIHLRHWKTEEPVPVSCEGSRKAAPRFRFLRHEVLSGTE
jgi:hypothetical protein